MANIIYRQMPAPREMPQQIPAHGQKLGSKSPKVGQKFWYKSEGVSGGGIVMDEIDTCIISTPGVNISVKDVLDKSAIMVCKVKFGTKILPVYSPLNIR